jgi:undecaprenyl-diphosphatase
MSWRADVAPSTRALVGAAVVALLCAAWFFAIAEDVADGGGLVSRDEAALGWIIDHRTDWWISIARVVSAVGSFVALLVLAAVLGAWLWRRRTAVPLAAAPAVALVAGSLLSTLAKGWYGRDRPPVALHATTVSLDAFPSGHATDAAAFFGSAAFVVALSVVQTRSAKIGVLGTGAALAAMVGVSRLVLAVHWLSDVVAGWALGTMVAVAVVTAAWWGATRGTQMDRSARDVAAT